MAGISSYISLITLNVNGLNSSNRSIEWMTGFKKKKDRIYVAYKRLNSALRIHIGKN